MYFQFIKSGTNRKAASIQRSDLDPLHLQHSQKLLAGFNRDVKRREGRGERRGERKGRRGAEKEGNGRRGKLE